MPVSFQDIVCQALDNKAAMREKLKARQHHIFAFLLTPNIFAEALSLECLCVFVCVCVCVCVKTHTELEECVCAGRMSDDLLKPS